jgi:opacity protein-like surface antigen
MKLATIVLATSLISTVACANIVPADKPLTGWYVGGNIGYATVDGNKDKMINDWALEGGYNFNQYAALEAGFNHYPASYEAQSFTLMAKGILPVAGTDFSVFGKAGVAFAHSDTIGASVAKPTIGLGVSYDITKDLQAEVQTSTVGEKLNVNSLDKFEKVLVGLVYKF